MKRVYDRRSEQDNGGTSVPPTFKGQKWKRENMHFGDALSVEKKANFFKRDRLFIITYVSMAKKKEHVNGAVILVES